MLPVLVWLLAPSNPRVAGLCHDDGIYLALGRSLIERGEYRDDHSPAPIQIAKYPPGVPLVAAAALSVTSDLAGAVTVIRLFNVLMLLVGLLSFHAILERVQLGHVAPVLVFALGWSKAVLDYVRVAMSEVPYLGLSLLAVLLLLRMRDREERPWRDPLVLALLCAGAVALRSFGVVLLAGACTWLYGIGRRRTSLRLALVAGPGALAVQLLVNAHASPAPGYEDVTVYGLPYLRIFIDSFEWIGATCLTNGLQVLLYGLHHLAPSTDALWDGGFLLLWLLVLGAAVLVFVGVRAEREEGPPPWHAIALLSVLLMIPWPAQVARFLLPLLPFLYIMMLQGMRRVAGPTGVVVLAGVLGVASLARSLPTRALQSVDSITFEGREHDLSRLLPAAASLTERIGDEAVVACTMDPLFAAHGRVRGVWGWTITADRHLYQSPSAPWRFNLDSERWDWVAREIAAARLMFHETAASPRVVAIRDRFRASFGPGPLARQGERRESLLARLEQDRDTVRGQFRRLGVTHAVLLPRSGNFQYEVLLARLVRALAGEGRARLVPGSTEEIQVWEIRP